MKFKEGNIVSKIDSFKNGLGTYTIITYTCILINITQKDINKGFNSDKPGLHLLRGFWNNTKKATPLNKKHYGKTEGHIDYYLKKDCITPLTLIAESVENLTSEQLCELLA